MKQFLTVLIILLIFPMILSGVETFKLASIFSQTGEAAITNQYQIRTIELAVEEINKNGGVLGLQIELINYDNQSSALGSILAAQKAVEDDVSAVIGASWSSHSLAMAPIFQGARIPMLTPSSTNPAVTEIGNYIFRVCYIDSFQGNVAAIFAREDLGVKNAVVLTNTGNKYSMELAATFIDRFTHYGGEILWEGDYLEPIYVESYLEKVKDLDPDLIFLPGYTRDSSIFIKSFRRAGIDAFILGGDGWSQNILYQYSENSLDGSYFVSHWHPDIQDPVSLEFTSRMRNYYKNLELDASFALSYDALNIMIHAVETAGSTDPDDIRAALSEIRDYRGVTGRISMDETGNPKKDAYILVFREGRPEFVKKVSP